MLVLEEALLSIDDDDPEYANSEVGGRVENRDEVGDGGFAATEEREVPNEN
jgi:hypothetical protein